MTTSLTATPLTRRIGACRHLIETCELSVLERCELLAVALWPGPGANNETQHHANARERAEAVAMHHAGHDLSDIAERYAVTRKTVADWVRAARA